MLFFEQAASWAIGLFLGFLFSRIYDKLISEKQFSGWRVIVKKGEEILCERPVGHRKAAEVLDDTTTLSVFIKGVTSPFCWLNEDVVSEKASVTGLFTVSLQKKQWVVDISKNPPPPPKK